MGRAILVAWALAGSVLLALAAGPAAAYEADVHDGLTRWLARMAGFTPSQSAAIALGNARVDSGLIDTMELVLEHACVGSDPEAAADVQARHHPSEVAVPAPAEARRVVPGSAAARRPLAALAPLLRGKEELMLARFGAALHTLQDSWSAAPGPSVPAPGAGIVCDPDRASALPPVPGHTHPHAASLTATRPASVLAMAAASYEMLLAYPAVAGVQRVPRRWAELEPLVERFARATDKTAKRRWFLAQGAGDTAFLHDTSLPDGPDPGPLASAATRGLLPPLQGTTSRQHDAMPELKDFFDQLVFRWIGASTPRSVVQLFAAGEGPPAARAEAARLDDLATLLTAWKLRDHGSAAALAHARPPYSVAHRAAVQRLAARPGALVEAHDLQSVFLPLLPKGEHASPLLPYIIRPLPPGADGLPRSIAIARLRHAPFDTIGLIAARRGAGWRLVDLVVSIDQ